MLQINERQKPGHTEHMGKEKQHVRGCDSIICYGVISVSKGRNK